MSLNLRNALSNAFVGGGGGGGASLSTNTFTGAQVISANGAASTPPLSLTGTVFTGGTSTTTKPQLLIEPSGTTSTGWSTSGTLLGVNAPSGFATAGLLADFQVNGTRLVSIGRMTGGGFTNAAQISGDGSSAPSIILNTGQGSISFRRLDTGPTFSAGYLWAGVPSDAILGFTSTSSTGNYPTGASTFDAHFARAAAASIKMGSLHATTPTNQTFSAHNVTTGTGAALTLAGGTGSVAGGVLNLATSATTGAPTTHIQIKASGVVNFASAAVVTETLVSDRTLAIEVGGVAYKICLKA
jgi:hypothetical protein